MPPSSARSILGHVAVFAPLPVDEPWGADVVEDDVRGDEVAVDEGERVEARELGSEALQERRHAGPQGAEPGLGGDLGVMVAPPLPAGRELRLDVERHPGGGVHRAAHHHRWLVQAGELLRGAHEVVVGPGRDGLLGAGGERGQQPGASERVVAGVVHREAARTDIAGHVLQRRELVPHRPRHRVDRAMHDPQHHGIADGQVQSPRPVRLTDAQPRHLPQALRYGAGLPVERAD